MRLTSSAWIAILSLGAICALLEAARRPRYGGVLRVDTGSVFQLDPDDQPATALASGTKARLFSQVFETLIRLDEKGQPQPWLAVEWVHEPARRRWIFRARPNVVFHNGSAWDPPEGVVPIADDRPIEEIVRSLASPTKAIFVRNADGTVSGTGPFRIALIENGKSLTLEAHERYWAGRPYLDSIAVRMGRSLRQQMLDADAGRVDLTEIAITDMRRLRQRGVRIATTAPLEIVALQCRVSRPDSLCERLSLSIDRNAIHQVLLQRQGEVSAALLPQWLSGYAFLFTPEFNLSRARQPAAALATFQYDRDDPLLRPLGERLTLNAADAGITLRNAASPNADIRLLRFHLPSTDARLALTELAAAFESPASGNSLYAMERGILLGYRVIPLFHLPLAHRLSDRVRNWLGARWIASGAWRFDNVWLEDAQ